MPVPLEPLGNDESRVSRVLDQVVDGAGVWPHASHLWILHVSAVLPAWLDQGESWPVNQSTGSDLSPGDPEASACTGIRLSVIYGLIIIVGIALVLGAIVTGAILRSPAASAAASSVWLASCRLLARVWQPRPRDAPSRDRQDSVRR